MDKKVIFIGLGVVALGGLAFFLFRKKGGAGADSSGGADTRSANLGAGASAGADPMYDESYDTSLDAQLGVPQTRKEIRQERRAVRRDCKAEAQAKGLRRLSRARREFMRECKAAGGENLDFMSEQSEFAFNGY
jgi:hypothetical protein